MEIIKTLFLNLSHENDEFRQDREDALAHVKKSAPKIKLEEASSLTTAKEKLSDSNNWDIFLVWVDDKSSNIWNELANFQDEHQTLNFLGIIVVFGCKESVREKARDAMLRGIYAFACPFNPYIFEAYIESIGLEAKKSKSLFKLKKDLLEAESFDKMIEFAILELKTNPIVGYDRATISLIDNKSGQGGQRYLLKYDSPRFNPDRRLLTAINEDKLMQNVDKKGVMILENLDDLRDNHPEELDSLGWEEKDATNDISSWVGLSVKHQNKSIAIITLDHQTPGYYARYDDKLNQFLKGFSDILADAIAGFLLERNERIIREITSKIGGALKSKTLIYQILVKLRGALNCDNCTYFKVSSPIHVSETFLEEWVVDNSPIIEGQLAKRISFKKGMGIVGAVLADGKSRIIPHALDSEEFEQTFHFPGNNLSILAVPVIPHIDGDESRIIGVISCYKASKDHFTVYDRDLVEAISRITATVIERTMTLEYSNDISSKMSDLVLNKDKENLLRKICEHALTVTSARAAVIHRLEYSTTLENGEEKYRKKGDFYTFPEDIDPPDPRLDGEGTTDKVIQKKQTMEFSERLENFNCISEELRSLGIKYQIVVPLMIKNQSGQQRLVGALYLNKYSETPFSEVEKFALELFASQAANTIYHQDFLSERLTWTQANTDLAKAIEAIASRNDPSLLLKDIANYASSLAGASFSYLALYNDDGILDHKASCPEYILAELNMFYNDENNKEKRKTKGITGLAAKEMKTILIHDLKADPSDLKQEKPEYQQYIEQYIEFREGTRSELVVPIIGKEESGDKVIGVINLEHTEPYAFTEVHKEVIEHFARQVAIAYQKKNLVDAAKSKNNVLTGLQRSLQKIIESSPQNMLPSAVSLTREAIEAHEVIVIPIQKEKISAQDIVPSFYENERSFIHVLKETSLKVYREQKSSYCSDLKFPSNRGFNRWNIDISIISCGLCVPFSSRDEKIGVMWILFSKPFAKDFPEEDRAIYEVYASQIALAYTSAKQSEELKQKLAGKAFELTKNIDRNYKDARNQAVMSFTISMFTSIAGIILVFFGVYNLMGKNDKSSQAFTNGSGIATVVGVLMQAATVLVFNHGKATNKRMDRYHKELYNVRQLEILLSATEQLNSEASQQAKQQIIQGAANGWIKSVSEKNADEKNVGEVKNLDKSK